MREGERQTWGLTCTKNRRPRAKKIISHPASLVKPFLRPFLHKSARPLFQNDLSRVLTFAEKCHIISIKKSGKGKAAKMVIFTKRQKS